MNRAYADLERRFRRILALRDAESILHWDWSTMMPAGGGESRAEQLAELRALRHGLTIDAAIGERIAEARENESLSAEQRANVAEMDRIWRRATALDAEQVAAMSRACSACETAWRTARAEDDFDAVRPAMENVLARVCENAAALSERLGLDPYDALLDEFEPGGRAADIDAVFADLESFLPGFLEEALDAQARRPDPVLPDGPFPVDTQRALGMRFMRTLGFDFDRGRLDVSLHPFCGGTSRDVRITTRYDTADFTSALMGVLHETGHALYEMGLPDEWIGQPAGEARGMSLHESQSLLIEMQVCRSRPFLEYAAPIAREAFGGSGPAWEADNFVALYQRIGRGLIRVDADEVTYPLHVILRYRLERAMIAGDLAVADLPGAWNDGMKRLVGVTPTTNREGCLQDIHWYDGAWGYFPTYTLGAMMAAQIFDAARRADPAIPDGIAHGDFAPLLNWLRANVHGKGSLLSTGEILTGATGRPLDAAVFKAHLRERYLG